MAFDQKKQLVNNLRLSLSLLVAPLQYAADIPSRIYASLKYNTMSREELLTANKQLLKEQLLLKARLQKLEALEAENTRLNLLMQSTAAINGNFLVARILQFSPDTSFKKIVLDKGSKQGVFLGQPLIDSNGVMGQIVAVNPITSTALLIIDQSHALPVKNNRNGVTAIAFGTGDNNLLELNHITPTTDIKKGDLLVTSGLGRRFPAGFPVGEVVSIEHEVGEAFLLVKVAPKALFDRVREVLLIGRDDNFFSEIKEND